MSKMLDINNNIYKINLVINTIKIEYTANSNNFIGKLTLAFKSILPLLYLLNIIQLLLLIKTIVQDIIIKLNK